ncbi:endonuclease/exonuclease/phosphatase family protein [Erysipelothrix anatis]|uniref:endonuclease/exonuclease/phosphatase family protein n=1 Tax=Erysipelothrix anatis TaxID=2683713 RepID=UPI001359234A|nr:endonuclease/exonuclease/phosphatase family protein [Erysipelothrix anatis]
MLKVGTYNIRLLADDGVDSWKYRSQYLIETLEKDAYDVIGLQEVTPKQYHDLAQIPGYRLVGQAREVDGSGEASPILFNEQTLECLEDKTYWLSDTPDVPSKFENSACNRVATIATFRIKKSDVVFQFASCHIDHIVTDAQAKQIYVLMTLMDKSLPVIITGDFNLTPDAAPIQLLEAKYQSVARDSKFGTFNDFDTQQDVMDMERIDYIFLDDSWTIHASDIVVAVNEQGRYNSDHFPVVGIISQT